MPAASICHDHCTEDYTAFCVCGRKKQVRLASVLAGWNQNFRTEFGIIAHTHIEGFSGCFHFPGSAPPGWEEKTRTDKKQNCRYRKVDTVKKATWIAWITTFTTDMTSLTALVVNSVVRDPLFCIRIRLVISNIRVGSRRLSLLPKKEIHRGCFLLVRRLAISR
jgi:hypothetical protein